MKRQLTFKRKFQPQKDGLCSGDRLFIDFLIDDIPLSDYLGEVNSNIGKFGWANSNEAPNRIDYELSELNDLRSNQKSKNENGLFSIYVCAECGDEGCLAVMFKKETKGDLVLWKDFVWSNGEDEIDETHVKFTMKPLVFERDDYLKSFKILEEMIKKQAQH